MHKCFWKCLYFPVVYFKIFYNFWTFKQQNMNRKKLYPVAYFLNCDGAKGIEMYIFADAQITFLLSSNYNYK